MTHSPLHVRTEPEPEPESKQGTAGPQGFGQNEEV
jgi:hypothetical protein